MMKLTELILALHTLMLEKGNLNVYVRTDDWYSGVEDPNPYLSEGGTFSQPYPGVYLN